MALKTAEQAVHDFAWKYLSSLMDCYETRPMTEVSYPFADFDESDTAFSSTKSGPLAQVSLTVNVWDKESNRKSVSSACYGLIQEIAQATEMYGYFTSMSMSDTTVKISQDTTVTPPVWRGMVTIKVNIGG